MDNGFEEEQPLDPSQPIIDPHLHLWEILPSVDGQQQGQRFLLSDAAATIERSGHNITDTVFVECHAMYRQSGAPDFMPVGETEFANGMAAMSASGGYGRCNIARRIVANANMLLGANVRPVLEAHAAAARERFTGVRFPTAYSQNGLFGKPCASEGKGRLLSKVFREAANVLVDMNLSLDVWCVHSQLDELIDLADAVPDLSIILDHLGTPECHGIYAGREAEARHEWSQKIVELSQRSNVRIKLGGLGMDISRQFGSKSNVMRSETLAENWRPFIDTCIDAFTPERCMFESNFPPDNSAGTYGAIWNAFKIIARDYSRQEKNDLFQRTAAQAYHIPIAGDA